MRFAMRWSLAVAALSGLAASASAAGAASSEGDPRLGVALRAIGPSSGAGVVFVDALQQAGPWASTTAAALILDAEGNVASLGPAQAAERVVYANEDYPAGDYHLSYAGSATFEVAGATIVARAPGRLTIRVPRNSGTGLRLRMTSTDPSDPTHNVRLLLPGYGASDTAPAFAPEFVRALRTANVLRFGDWMHGGAYAESSVWPLRPRLSRATQVAPNGVAPEYMIALANQTGADPWFTLPVGATDAYAYGFAQLVHRTLDPRLHPMFEYGSEVWKPRTPANGYALMAARNVRLRGAPAAAALNWYASRSARIFGLVQTAFGRDAYRVVRVISGPVADPRGAGTAIDSFLLDRIANAADAFAVSADGDGTDVVRAAAISHTAQLARARGLALIAYEGGEPIADDAPAARAAYDASLESWHRAGGGLWVGAPAGYAARGVADYAARHPSRHVVAALAAPLVPGNDAAPEGGDRVHQRPLPVRPFSSRPLVSRRGTLKLFGHPGVAAALGTPLERVDLSAEGRLDWLYVGRGPSLERKAAGVAPLEFAATELRAPGSIASALETYTWSDARGSARGNSRDGLALAKGRLTLRAPADALLERVLRIYVGVDGARGVLPARLGGTELYRDDSLAGRGSRAGVYTFVYRAAAPGQQLVVTFEPESAYAAHASIALRAATLAPNGSAPSVPAADEATYHNDLTRTGWNPNETLLNPSNVASSSFKALAQLPVDDNVLAQPLYLSQYTFPGGGTHNVLIVATENDTLYEFDADTGAQINSVNFGTAQSSTDVGCPDIVPHLGITSTPVIDRAHGTIYLVAATEPSPNVFHTQVHALDIGTLNDVVPPVEIAATETLSNGATLSFDPLNQMNRVGLVLANNSLYVGVGSHCDNSGNITGWILRYNRRLNTLGALAIAEDPARYHIDSVWMAGFAPAVDQEGFVYVVTGNGPFDGVHNFGESALKVGSKLKSVVGWFTPHEYATLNKNDEDFGSAGIMVLPTQQGNFPNLAVAMGKSSKLYLLDRDHMGRVSSNDHGALQVVQDSGHGVWGGPAFFNGPTGQFVYYQTDTDALHAYGVQVDTSGNASLTLDSAGTVGGGYGGSTPIVSSNGQTPNTGIVWLIGRESAPTLLLEAYDASDVSKLLFQGTAGTWSNPQHNPFLTPLVANGRVYVPGTNAVTVFGLGP